MLNDAVIIIEEENNERTRSCSDYIFYFIELFIIFILIFALVYMIAFLFKMIESMTFPIKY